MKSIPQQLYEVYYKEYLTVPGLQWDNVSQSERDDWQQVADTAVRCTIPEDRPTRPCCYLVDCSEGFDVTLEDEL